MNLGLTEGDGRSVLRMVRATKRQMFQISELPTTNPSSEFSHQTIHQIMLLIHCDLPSSVAIH